jgi:hypothetical protein
MKKIIFSILLFTYQMAFCQIDSLYNKILNYQDSTKIFIGNARMLALDFFDNHKLQELKELKQVVDYKINDSNNYIAFLPLEKTLIDYWIKDYDDAIQQLYYTVGRDDNFYINKNFPSQDALYGSLLIKSKDQYSNLIDTLNSSFVRNIDKDFLKLSLYKIIQNDKDSINQDFINKLSNDFIRKYPQSEYDTIIRAAFRFVTKESKMGYGMELIAGTGNFTNTLSNQFKNPVSIGIGFDLTYYEWFFSPRIIIGISKLKKDITQNEIVWESGKQANIGILELPFGYNLLKNNKNRLLPYAGLTLADAGPVVTDTDKNENLRKAALKMRTGYQVGISFDLNLGKQKSYGVFYDNNEVIKYYLRLKYNYNTINFEKNQPGLKGGFHGLTLAISMYGRSIKRDF